jgi:hypothetical protein
MGVEVGYESCCRGKGAAPLPAAGGGKERSPLVSSLGAPHFVAVNISSGN